MTVKPVLYVSTDASMGVQSIASPTVKDTAKSVVHDRVLGTGCALIQIVWRSSTIPYPVDLPEHLCVFCISLDEGSKIELSRNTGT